MKKYIDAKVTPATAAEAELLDCLIEEASEVIKECTKILRSGFGYMPPAGRVSGVTNRHRLQEEIGDFLAVYSVLFSTGVVDQNKVEEARISKLERLPFFLLES